MAPRRCLSSIVLAVLVLIALSASAASAQSQPGPSTGGAMRRADSGSGVALRDWYVVGRIGGFVPWATPRWLPGAGRPTRTFESTPVRPRTSTPSRLVRSRLP
jgi:hypothetical protein